MLHAHHPHAQRILAFSHLLWAENKVLGGGDSFLPLVLL
jgi:hypothetical protein